MPASAGGKMKYATVHIRLLQPFGICERCYKETPT